MPEFTHPDLLHVTHRNTSLPEPIDPGAPKWGRRLIRGHPGTDEARGEVVVEGADQPFLLEIVAAQASSGRRAGCSFIAGTS